MTKQRAFLPNLAIRNDLLSSGHLSIIQSDSIRYRILSDEQKRNRVASAEMSERSYIENQLVDYLITKKAYSLLSFEEDFNEIIISERDARLITKTLLRDPSFFDHLYARLTRLQAVISSAEPVLLNLSSLERKLEEELSKVD